MEPIMLAFEGSAGGVLELSINAATNRFFSSSEKAPALNFSDRSFIVSVRFINSCARGSTLIVVTSQPFRRPAHIYLRGPQVDPKTKKPPGKAGGFLQKAL